MSGLVYSYLARSLEDTREIIYLLHAEFFN